MRDLDDGVNYAAVNNVRHPAGLARPGAGAALGPLRRRGRRQRAAGERQGHVAGARARATRPMRPWRRARPSWWRPSGPTTTWHWEARRVGAQQHLLPLRGPAEFELAHEAIRLEAGRAEYVSLTFPVAPLTDSTLLTTTIASHTQPTVITTLPNSLGTAPNRMDVAFRHPAVPPRLLPPRLGAPPDDAVRQFRSPRSASSKPRRAATSRGRPPAPTPTTAGPRASRRPCRRADLRAPRSRSTLRRWRLTTSRAAPSTSRSGRASRSTRVSPARA